MKRVFCVITVVVAVAFASFNVYAANSDVLAKVGETVITRADFDMIVGFLPEQQQAAIKADPEKQRMVLENITRNTAIAGKAKAAGLDKKPEAQRGLQLFSNDFLARLYVKQEVIDKITLSNKELEDYFAKHKKEFAAPEVKARHILIKADMKPDADKTAMKKRAEEALARVRAGEDFAQVAKEVSEDPGTKGKGGDLGFIRKGQMVPEFEMVAFSMKAGEVSEVVESRFGFHIIKVEERKDQGGESFATASENTKKMVMEKLKRERIMQFNNEILKDKNVKMYPERLAGGSGKSK